MCVLIHAIHNSTETEDYSQEENEARASISLGIIAMRLEPHN